MSKPMMSKKTRNVLAAVLLVLLAVVVALLLKPHQLSPPDPVEAAQEIAIAFSNLDYRDREGWTARVKEVCTDEGWAFWANGLDEMWADVTARQTVTTKVIPLGAWVLRTWEDGRTYVEVHIHAEGHGKGGPFSQDLTYNFVLAPSKHGWRFAGLIPAAVVE